MAQFDYIPAISLSPPWSELILYAGKSVENRVWTSRYRGPLILHNAQKSDWARTMTFLQQRFSLPDGSLPRKVEVALEMDHPTGFVGVVQFSGEHSATNGGFCCAWGFEGQYHKEVSKPLAFGSVIEGRGRQTLFRPPEAVQAAAVQLLIDHELPTGIDPHARANSQGMLF